MLQEFQSKRFEAGYSMSSCFFEMWYL